MHGQFFARLAALVIGALGAAAPLPIRTPVSAVAASEDGAVALMADEVRVMDATGFPVGRLARLGARTMATSRRPARRGAGFAAAAGVLDDGDFNDAHDPDSEVEDPENVLDEDGPSPRRRTQVVPASRDVSLAIGGDAAWVGRGDGLWRLPFAGGAERMALPVAGPVRQVASSADGRVLVAALDGAIVRSDDRGARFERIADGPARVDRLVVTNAGQVYALAADGLRRLRAGAPDHQVVRQRFEDVATCGSEVLALSNRRLTVLAGVVASREEERDDFGADVSLVPPGPMPSGAGRVACSPDGAVWVAYGAALWISEDRGQSWKARPDMSATFPIASVAVTRRALWVAGRAGLAVLPLHAAPASVHAGPSRPSFRLSDVEAPPPRWRWWLSALPRVDLGLASTRSTTRRDLRAFVLLSFTFDPRRDVRAERQVAADARAAGRREAAQKAQLQRAGEDSALDPIALEERDAISRLLD